MGLNASADGELRVGASLNVGGVAEGLARVAAAQRALVRETEGYGGAMAHMVTLLDDLGRPAMNLWAIMEVGKNALAALGTGLGLIGQAAGIIVRISDEIDKRQSMMEASLADIGALTDATKNLVGTNEMLVESSRLMNADFNVGQQNMEMFARAAWNLAERSGKSWKEAMDAIANAAMGSTKSLKQFGIVLPEAAEGADKLKNVIDALTPVADSAEVRAGSLAEKLMALDNAAKNAAAGGLMQLAEAFGSLFGRGPGVIEGLTGALQRQAERSGAMGAGPRVRRQIDDLKEEIAQRYAATYEQLIGAGARAVKNDALQFFHEADARIRALSSETRRAAERQAEEMARRQAAADRESVRQAEEAMEEIQEQLAFQHASAEVDRRLAEDKTRAAEARRKADEAALSFAREELNIRNQIAAAGDFRKAVAEGLASKAARERRDIETAVQAAREGMAYQEDMRQQMEDSLRMRREGETGLGAAGLTGPGEAATMYNQLQQAAEAYGQTQAWVNEQISTMGQVAQQAGGEFAGVMNFAEQASEQLMMSILTGSAQIVPWLMKMAGGYLKQTALRIFGEAALKESIASTFMFVPGMQGAAVALIAAAQVDRAKAIAMGALGAALGVGGAVVGASMGGGGGGGGGEGGGRRSPGVGAVGGDRDEQRTVNVYIGDNAIVQDHGRLAEYIRDALGTGARRGRVGTVDAGGRRALVLD